MTGWLDEIWKQVDRAKKGWVFTKFAKPIEAKLLQEVNEEIPYGTVDQAMSRLPQLVRMMLEDWDTRVFADGNIFRVEEDTIHRDGNYIPWFVKQKAFNEMITWKALANRFHDYPYVWCYNRRSGAYYWEPRCEDAWDLRLPTEEEEEEYQKKTAEVHPALLYIKWLDIVPEMESDPDDALNGDWETLPEWADVHDDDDPYNEIGEDDITQSQVKAMCKPLQYKLKFCTGEWDSKQEKWDKRFQECVLANVNRRSEKMPQVHNTKRDYPAFLYKKVETVHGQLPEGRNKRACAKLLFRLDENPGYGTFFSCMMKIPKRQLNLLRKHMRIVRAAYKSELTNDLRQKLKELEQSYK